MHVQSEPKFVPSNLFSRCVPSISHFQIRFLYLPYTSAWAHTRGHAPVFPPIQWLPLLTLSLSLPTGRTRAPPSCSSMNPTATPGRSRNRVVFPESESRRRHARKMPESGSSSPSPISRCRARLPRVRNPLAEFVFPEVGIQSSKSSSGSPESRHRARFPEALIQSSRSSSPSPESAAELVFPESKIPAPTPEFSSTTSSPPPRHAARHRRLREGGA